MPPLSRDEALIRALTAPTPEGAALLDSISSFELADFLDRPEVQRALAAREYANAVIERAQHQADMNFARDELKKNIAASTDLPDPGHNPCHREAPSGDFPPSSSTPSKLLGADSRTGRRIHANPERDRLTVLLTLYRTASIAYRATLRATRSTGFQAVSAPASLRARAGAARPSPLPGHVEPPPSVPPAHALTCSGAQPASSPPHLPTSRSDATAERRVAEATPPPQPLAPAGHRRGPPASQFPGAREAIANFLRVAGSPQTLCDAFPLVSWYRRNPLGQDGVLKWIESLPAITSHTAAGFGPVAYDDEYDLATQHVRLTLPDGACDALITANVESDDDLMPARWGINNIAVSAPGDTQSWVARPAGPFTRRGGPTRASDGFEASRACAEADDAPTHAHEPTPSGGPSPPSESSPPTPDTS